MRGIWTLTQPFALAPQLCISAGLPCHVIVPPFLYRLGLPANMDLQLFLQDQVSKDKAFQTMATMSSAQLISAPSLQAKLGPAGPQVAWVGDCGVQGWRGGVGFQQEID